MAVYKAGMEYKGSNFIYLVRDHPILLLFKLGYHAKRFPPSPDPRDSVEEHKRKTRTQAISIHALILYSRLQ